MDFISCAPTTLYRGGGFFEDSDLLTTLSDPAQTAQGECRLIGEVFAPFFINRPAPVLLTTMADDFRVTLEDTMAGLNAHRRQGAASALVCLDSGFLHCNVLYTRSAAGVRVVYETYRPNDRPYVPIINPLDGPYPHEPMSDSTVLDLFIGSAGSGNYGHWLVDDLPRAAAVEKLRRHAGRRSIRIWLSDAGEPMNTVRIASLQKVCAGLDPIEIRIARLDRIYDFKRLHYVTPVSYHPVLKSTSALDWVTGKLAGAPGGRRLFVLRKPERMRGLVNLDAVWGRLSSLGFEAVEAEELSFEQQAALFSQASMVIGCMGAAMTNSLFCRSGTPLLYLVPEGWQEPFYWDLAAVCGHPYHAVYGALADPTVPAHLAPYTIDLGHLEQGLAALGVS